MAEELKRERRTGGFYRRSAKFLKLIMNGEDRQQAGRSRKVHKATFKAVVNSPPNAEPTLEMPAVTQKPLPVGPEDPLTVVPEETERVSDHLGKCNSFSGTSQVEARNTRTFETMPVVDGIRHWALSNNETHRSIDMVLQLFRRAGVDVPLTARDLLQNKTHA